MKRGILKEVALVVSLCVAGMIVSQTGCSKPSVPARSYDEYVQQASALFKEKRYDEALAEAQEAIKQDAGRYQAHAVKALILCDMGRLDKAKAAVNDALQVAPENKLAEAQNIAKYIAGAQGKTAGPATDQQRASVARNTRKKPGTASRRYDDHVKQARALFKEQKREEALAAAREAIKLDADRYQAYAIEALILSDEGKFAEAQSAVDKALQLAPEDKREEVQAVAGHIAGTQRDGGVSTGPVASPQQQLTGVAQRRYEALMLIIEEADRAKLAVERNELLSEFLQKSEPFIREHQDLPEVWMLRAVAAVELNQTKPGWEAGKELIRLGAEDTEDPALRKVMAALERKGWLTDKASADAPRYEPNTGTTKDSLTDMELVFVKGGCFRMGSDEGADDEKPVHEVCLDDYCIGKYEVTQGQWAKVMGDNPSYFKKGDDYPVETVSWDDIQVFIQKLNQKTGQNYRLPTEAEWEYAARSGGKQERWAGTSNEAGLAGYAWFDKNSEEQTHPVGQKTPNGLGIYDMSGNVWEWCWDWYSSDYYSKSPRNNPNGPSGGSARVGRGGSWYNTAGNLRASNRNDYTPAIRGNNLGFRLARTL